MSLWNRLFGKSASASTSSPEEKSESSEALPDFPYELVRVPGREAVQACLRLREEGQGAFTPVMLGDLDNVNRIKDFFTGKETPQSYLEAAAGLTPEGVLESLKESDSEYYEQVEEGEWPARAPGEQQLTAHNAILSGRPKKTVFIAKLPTASAHEVPAYLKLGGWNECPTADKHVALHHYWHERYGARIISTTFDVIECTVERPPCSREEAIALAREQFIYCADIVYQGCGDIMNLAATLKDSKIWYFWWD
jgi:hypothetical protein